MDMERYNERCDKIIERELKFNQRSAFYLAGGNAGTPGMIFLFYRHSWKACR